ncbi:DUF805 domain-containing protein [Bifidobacterium sp. ESL0790]|uniref:DUF805 domain-containing protein n=1 Tax=Bifidobacterium sp. ESL0790 TaxID=2983233 RepID=UPI0023F72EBA|nr:DUF805 domain-containing protein [Bifidobacterium sp. ESL0790]WEV72604.1 DUF805 domain-containing protein [Bifidobacterium sp. ESL0790]
MSDTNPSFGPYNNAPASQGGQNNTPSTNPTGGYGNARPNGANAYPAYNGQAKQPTQPAQPAQNGTPGNANNNWQRPATPAYQQAPQSQGQQQRPQGYTPAPASAPTQPMGGQRPYQAPNANPTMGAAAPSRDLPYYGCSFIEAIKRFFTKYVVFSGRASRSEYWWAQLFLFLAAIVFIILDAIIFGKGNYLLGLWNLAVLIPSLAVMIRRLHDSNKSGWWALLPYGLVVVGLIVMVASMGIGAVAGGGDVDTMAGGAAIGLIIYGLCALGYFIAWLVLMISGPNPAGARFDSNRVVVPANVASPSSSIPMPTGAAQPQNRNVPNAAAANSHPYGQNGAAPAQTTTGYNQPKPAAQPQYTNPSATQAQQPYKSPQVPPAQKPASAAPQPSATPQTGAAPQSYQPYTQPGTPTQNGGQPGTGNNGYGQPRQ